MDNQSPKIAIIGGGFGGMCAAIQLEKQLGLKSYIIFDENENFGGTWLVNKYPACACDIQSHLYSLSFEPNPNWTEQYSSQPEILEYIHRVARKYGLYKKAKFSTLIKSVEWGPKEGQWMVTTLDKKSGLTQVQNFDFTINAVGMLRQAYTPKEFDSFTGVKLHSAEYDPTIDLQGKVVGLVGSGASAVQIVSCIAPNVKELHSYQRKPGWVGPRNQFKFPAVVKTIFTYVPLVMWLYRCFLFLINEYGHRIFNPDSSVHKSGVEAAMSHLKETFPGNEEIQQKLMPNFKFGCKRLLFHENYLSSFNLSHVHLHREPIEKIEGSTITSGGVTRKLDVLILATGFKTQEFFHPLKITNKIDLLTKWREEGPSSYYGIMCNDTPNAFMLLGPNTIS